MFMFAAVRFLCSLLQGSYVHCFKDLVFTETKFFCLLLNVSKVHNSKITVFAILRFYYYLPIEDEKPLLWVKGVFEEHRRRMYNTNMLEKIVEKLVGIFSRLLHQNYFFLTSTES